MGVRRTSSFVKAAGILRNPAVLIHVQRDFRSRKIPEDVQEYAGGQGMTEVGVLKKGDERKEERVGGKWGGGFTQRGETPMRVKYPLDKAGGVVHIHITDGQRTGYVGGRKLRVLQPALGDAGGDAVL